MERLRYGMVGGAVGAYIGDTHRYGAQMDHLAELAAGCFSRDYEKSLETARIWKLEDTSRIYRDYREMAEKEAAREDGTALGLPDCHRQDLQSRDLCGGHGGCAGVAA